MKCGQRYILIILSVSKLLKFSKMLFFVVFVEFRFQMFDTKELQCGMLLS